MKRSFSQKVLQGTYIIFLEESRVLQGVLGGQDHVLQELAVRQRRHVVVAAVVVGQPLQSLSVDAARVDPLGLGLESILSLSFGRNLRIKLEVVKCKYVIMTFYGFKYLKIKYYT
jgi:hypothetical protein